MLSWSQVLTKISESIDKSNDPAEPRGSQTKNSSQKSLQQENWNEREIEKQPNESERGEFKGFKIWRENLTVPSEFVYISLLRIHTCIFSLFPNAQSSRFFLNVTIFLFFFCLGGQYNFIRTCRMFLKYRNIWILYQYKLLTNIFQKSPRDWKDGESKTSTAAQELPEDLQRRRKRRTVDDQYDAKTQCLWQHPSRSSSWSYFHDSIWLSIPHSPIRWLTTDCRREHANFISPGLCLSTVRWQPRSAEELHSASQRLTILRRAQIPSQWLVSLEFFRTLTIKPCAFSHCANNWYSLSELRHLSEIKR